MIFVKNLFKGVGLATLYFNRYNMAQGLLGRSCFKYLNIIKKSTPSSTPNLKKLQKFFFVCDDIFLKKTLIPYYTIGKFRNLVTSFFTFEKKVF